VPWCEPCSRYLSQTSLTDDGACPSCGTELAKPEKEKRSIPWHFWVLIVATVIYLGYRLVQGIVWAAHGF
jgi:uncharacterized paraquat-inducible protein A